MQRNALLVLVGGFVACLAACGTEPGSQLLTPQQIAQGHSESAFEQGSSTQTCVGEPEPCASYDDAAQCGGADGCEPVYASCVAKACREFGDATSCYQNRCQWRFACGGQADTCYQADRATCVRQPGCSWLEESGLCSGVARACGSYHDPVSCVAQPGCGVLRGCEESIVAPGCLLNNTEAKCESNQACAWEPETCNGSPAACKTYTSQAACGRVRGCSWL